jgi:hypothetical protein
MQSPGRETTSGVELCPGLRVRRWRWSSRSEAVEGPWRLQGLVGAKAGRDRGSTKKARRSGRAVDRFGRREAHELSA